MPGGEGWCQAPVPAGREEGFQVRKALPAMAWLDADSIPWCPWHRSRTVSCLLAGGGDMADSVSTTARVGPARRARHAGPWRARHGPCSTRSDTMSRIPCRGRPTQAQRHPSCFYCHGCPSTCLAFIASSGDCDGWPGLPGHKHNATDTQASQASQGTGLPGHKLVASQATSWAQAGHSSIRLDESTQLMPWPETKEAVALVKTSKDEDEALLARTSRCWQTMLRAASMKT